jgi:multisubunit Na+/H+ antiporter MnhG subunit
VSETAGGEAIERGRQRRKWAVLGGLAAFGGIGGGIVGAHEADRLFDLAQPWPPLLCLALAIGLVIAVTVGSVVLSREMDEVERLAKLKATRAGASVYILGYPLWFLLWKGGFVPEPMHVALFAATIVALILASLFYRFR